MAIGKENEVPPLAQASYRGTNLLLKYKNLSVSVSTELSRDKDNCYDKPDGADACKVLRVLGMVDGQQVFTMPAIEVEDNHVEWINATVAIRRLDPATSLPQVVLSYSSMGAHCCIMDEIMTVDPSGKWSAVKASPDGADDDGGFSGGTEGGYRFLDLDHDGGSELVDGDMNFNYEFSSHGGSNPPTRIWNLSGTTLKSVAKSGTYQAFALQELRKMEAWYRNNPSSEINGYLAGWVAQSALAGRLDTAWKFMLGSYDHEAPDGREVCRIDLPIYKCPSGQTYMVSFPQALAVFLFKLGYLTSDQAKSLGYDVVRIMADRAAGFAIATAGTASADVDRSKVAEDGHGASIWYSYLNDGRCVEATDPPSPGYLINFDRSNNLADEVYVIKYDDAGKPLIVKVGEPEGNGMSVVYTFAHNLAACEDYSQQRRQNINDFN